MKSIFCNCNECHYIIIFLCESTIHCHLADEQSSTVFAVGIAIKTVQLVTILVLNTVMLAGCYCKDKRYRGHNGKCITRIPDYSVISCEP